MAFKIKKVRPLFTGVVTTAKKYVGEVTTGGGLIVDTTKMSGSLNPYQTVLSVGNMCHDVKEGDIVKLNLKRYLIPQHVNGVIDTQANIQSDRLDATYQIPEVILDDQECLFLQVNDIEYVVEDYEVDEGGLLQ